jgi:hypothetical protein
MTTLFISYCRNVVPSKFRKDQRSGDWKDTGQIGHGDRLNAARVLARPEQFISEQ